MPARANTQAAPKNPELLADLQVFQSSDASTQMVEAVEVDPQNLQQNEILQLSASLQTGQQVVLEGDALFHSSISYR